jgi:uncharacterized protein (TIGR02466 family)|tara:strand:- start:4166 stop:4780 length:615 start_codon:yes stop_codon:yes gene_type:complete
MKKESIFPVEIYEFYNKDVAAECLKLFKEEPTWKNDNVPTGVKTCKSVETNPKYQFMMDWFQSCFDEIAEDLALECDSLKANKAWGNWSPAWSGWYHSAHRHAMSYYSGVFYLTDGPPTYFVDPVQQREWAHLHVESRKGATTGIRSYSMAKPGRFVVFPGWLIHGSLPNNDPEDRYTVACNSFPSGEINHGGDTYMLKLEVSK